ncbi:MAG: serine hydrolase [Terracidiphilus sp.]
MRNLRPAAVAAALAFTLLAGHAQVPAAKPPVKSPLNSPVPAPVTNAPAKAKLKVLAPAEPAQEPASAVAIPAHPLDAADLNGFFDGVLSLQLERSDIAGATVLVMQNGNVLLERGYGYSNLKDKTPVDPASTIFRLASISKLFTWVSVMQLEEQGKLDIDADVNRYLDFKIRPAFGESITLRNLMTHTGGFEEVADDIILTNPKKAPTLREDLIENQPMRLFPPGQIPAYSNYGVGLASYIVQRVSGEPFQQYVEEHIFAPLGMTHSSFYQPLPKQLAGSVSEGYLSSTLKPPMGFEIFNPVGAGGVSSTAADMGRFGQALLNGGELDGHRILEASTLAQMWTPQFQANPQLPPICMGFYQDWRNNLHWIGHEGDLVAFHSLFFMEPQQKLILFVSYNSVGGEARPRPEIIDFFSDRYFPGAPKTVFLKTPLSQLRAIDGRYVTTRRADSTKLKLLYLFSQLEASVSKDGVLTVSGDKDLRNHTVKWKPIGQDLWQAENGQSRLFAIRNSHNRVVRIAGEVPAVQLQRVPWYEDSRLVLWLVSVSLAILTLVVLATLWRLGHRIFYRKRPRPAPQPGNVWLTVSPRIAAWVWVLFLGSLAGFFIATSNSETLFPNPSWFKWFVLENWDTALALLLSIFAIVSGVRIWWRANLRWITKVKFSLVGAACLILSWFAIYWHLIGPAHRI